MFLVFEGIEGSGKSTQAELLTKALTEKDVEVDLTREPGGTEVGDKIRAVLLDSSLDEMHPRTELLLYLAARAEHIAKRIRRKLFVDKAVVICDRYMLSTLAYQAGGRKIDVKTVSRLGKFATGGLDPDLTVLVDLDVERAFARLDRTHDRIEKAGTEFHLRVRKAYLEFARRSPARIRVFDGAKEKMTLHEEIKEVVYDLLTRKGIL
ncbi:dTMP kinase [candidate division WOR-3 bacterium]|nr:dTMP kinase [candidate division WOR-3 bacterium]